MSRVTRGLPSWPYRNTVLALATGSFFATMVARLVLSPNVPAITADLGVSKSEVGLALTGMWALYALFQFPSGVLGERYGERRVILAALGLTGAGSALVAVAPGFGAFALFALCLGGGAGLYFSAGTALLTRQFEKTGHALGFHTAGGPLAGLLGPLAAAYVGTRYGWRAATLLGAAVAVPLFVAAVLALRETPPVRPETPVRERFDPGVVVHYLSKPRTAFTTVVAVVTVFVWQSFASFFPTFLVEYHGYATGDASAAFAAVFALSAVCLPVLGTLSDRVGRDAVLVTCLVAAGTGFAALLAGTGLPALLAGVGGLGVGLSWMGTVQSRLMDTLAVDERGTGFGLVRTVYMLVSSLGSVVTGTAAEAAGWPVAVGLLVGLVAVTAVALVGNRALGLGL
ncbi:MFS transporter [Halobacteriales archaeon QS_1_68_17]|nr:MAG: MFS transporter [Halobacteriales archaeon QS_1_68_17]